jgi:hypothetical protein
MASESQLADRAAAVEKQISGLASSLTAKQMLTAILGFGLLAAIAGFYWYGYTMVKPMLEPKMVVDAGVGLALDNMPAARKEIVGLAKEQLPQLAQFASSTALEQLPSVRGQLEGMLLAGADKALVEHSEPLRATMREMVRKNKRMLAEGAQELTKSPAEADKYLKNIAELTEKELGADLDKTVGTMAGAIEGFGDTLANANVENAKRSSLQVMLREMLMLSKRLSIEMSEGVALPKEAMDLLKSAPGGAGGATDKK